MRSALADRCPEVKRAHRGVSSGLIFVQVTVWLA
jgi:hypothetical protein